MMLSHPSILIPVVVLVILFCAIFPVMSQGSGLTASWYSVDSCLREGTSGIMANGQKLDDSRYTAASWDYPFGTRLKVVNARTGRGVIVQVTDRGPAKKLYRQGRVIDLSKAAFARIADLDMGIVPITIEEVRNGNH